MNRISALLVATGFAFGLSGPTVQTSVADEAPAARTPSPHCDEVAAAQAALAWKLLSAFPNDGQTVVSPASLGLAASTVALGASQPMKAALSTR